MNRSVPITAIAVILLAVSSAAQSANMVRVDSISFVPPSTTRLVIGAYFTNDVPVAAFVMPLEIRSMTGGAYIAPGPFNARMNPAGRMYNSPLGAADPNGGWPAAVIVDRIFPTAEPWPVEFPANCQRPWNPETMWKTSAAAIDFLSPDATFLATYSVGDPRAGEEIELMPGSDPPGVPFYRITTNIGANPGVFVIDTTCVTPANHLDMVDRDAQRVPIGFQRGIIGVGVEARLPGAGALMQIDVNPGRCPNHLNVNRGRKQVSELEVAIVGQATFDVDDINPMTVALEGIDPLRWTRTDVSAPSPDGNCHRSRGDGLIDLVLVFDESEVAAAVGSYPNRTEIALRLTALANGQSLSATDVVIVQGGMAAGADAAAPGETGLANHPNPFNAATTISYSLREFGPVHLDVFNILGQRIARLVDDHREAGHHTVTWDARDDNGRELASGVYLYRLSTPGDVIVRRMLLLK